MATATQVDVLWAGLRDNSGQPLAGGKVYAYEAGTDDPKALYDEQDMSDEAANPVILDAYGRALVYGSGAYKLVVKTTADVTLQTLDNLRFGLNEGGAIWCACEDFSDQFTLTPSIPIESLTQGLMLQFIASKTTDDPTWEIFIDGFPTYEISNHAVSGTIQEGELVTIVYNGALWTLVANDYALRSVLSYSPTYTASGSMTWGTITTGHARYRYISPTAVWFSVVATGTTGGVASNELQVTLPVLTSLSDQMIAAHVYDSNAVGGFGAISSSSDFVRVFRYDRANYGLGAGRGVAVAGIYLIS